MKEYYNQDNIIVRTSIKSDIDFLKDRLRQSDKDEIWASNHLTPEIALNKCLDKSILCCTIMNSHPIGMFGIVPVSLLGNTASIWFLASDDLDKIKRRFLLNSKYFIGLMLEYYPYLFNFVDDRNKDSIQWLKFCGAGIEEPKTYGIEQKPFRYFYFQRS